VGYYWGVSGFWTYGKEPAHSNGRGLGLSPGGGTFVRAAGGCCPGGQWCGLLRRRVLPNPWASSSPAPAWTPVFQRTSRTCAGFVSHGLRARDERHETLHDVVLRRSGAPRVDAHRVRIASSGFCAHRFWSDSSGASEKFFRAFAFRNTALSSPPPGFLDPLRDRSLSTHAHPPEPRLARRARNIP